MNTELMLIYVLILFALSEIALLVFKRSKATPPAKGDQGSLMLLWLTIIGSVGLTVFLQWYPSAILPLPRPITNAVALSLLTGGLIIRWISIVSLGKFFTVDIAIQEQHILVQRGLYRYVRHPSYTGLLVEFVGLALYFGTWVSLAILLIPITSAMIYRIRCEEVALVGEFGKQYEEYKAHTKAVIPGVI